MIESCEVRVPPQHLNVNQRIEKECYGKHQREDVKDEIDRKIMEKKAACSESDHCSDIPVRPKPAIEEVEEIPEERIPDVPNEMKTRLRQAPGNHSEYSLIGRTISTLLQVLAKCQCGILHLELIILQVGSRAEQSEPLLLLNNVQLMKLFIRFGEIDDALDKGNDPQGEIGNESQDPGN